MTTQIAKGVRGWQARTIVPLNLGNKVLVISTHKTQGGLATSFIVNAETEPGVLCWELFGDYSKRVGHKGARCTEKNTRELHQKGLEQVDQILIDALNHYASERAIK